MTKNRHRQFSYPWALFVIAAIYPDWSFFASILFFVAVVLGSSAPDFLEGRIIKHRTYTHLPIFWLFCFAVGTSLTVHYELGAAPFVFIAGICLGAITHWAGDWGTPMGVPFFTPHKRYSLNLWKTGHLSELKPIFFAWVVLAVFLCGKFYFL